MHSREQHLSSQCPSLAFEEGCREKPAVLFCARCTHPHVLSLLKTGSMLLGRVQQEGQQGAQRSTPAPVPVPQLRKEWRLEGDLPQVMGVPASALKLEYNLQPL